MEATARDRESWEQESDAVWAILISADAYKRYFGAKLQWRTEAHKWLSMSIALLSSSALASLLTDSKPLTASIGLLVVVLSSVQFHFASKRDVATLDGIHRRWIDTLSRAERTWQGMFAGEWPNLEGLRAEYNSVYAESKAAGIASKPAHRCLVEATSARGIETRNPDLLRYAGMKVLQVH